MQNFPIPSKLALRDEARRRGKLDLACPLVRTKPRRRTRKAIGTLGIADKLQLAKEANGVHAMSLGTILLIILIIFLLGGFSGRFGGYGYGYGHRGVGLIGVIVIILLVLLLLGHI
jgi:hypothetical protein